LELIVEAVKYCQLVKGMRMPLKCYTKALREPVFFLWECRFGAPPKGISGPKECAAKYRSEKSKGRSFGKRKLNYDHAIPFRYLQDKLLKLTDVTPVSVAKVLEDFCVTALIKPEEHRLLSRRGLGKGMPEGWNGHDPLARYKAVGIKMVRNELYSDCHVSRRGSYARSPRKRKNSP
jgi:hypothetical protein